MRVLLPPPGRTPEYLRIRPNGRSPIVFLRRGKGRTLIHNHAPDHGDRQWLRTAADARPRGRKRGISMKLTDFQPTEKWVELQEELHKRYALNADIMDHDGKRLVENTWGNDLCKAIRGDKKGFGAICAPAGQMFLQLMREGEPFAEECDGGMMRIGVPVMKDGEFLGAVGGCGVYDEDGEVDEFTIDMMSDLDADAIADMAQTVKSVSADKVAEIQEFIQAKLAEMIG